VVSALRWLLADRQRRWLAPLLCGAVALAWFDFGRMVVGRQPQFWQIAAAPQRYAGREIRLGYAEVRRLTAEGFEAEVNRGTVPVSGRLEGLRVGTILSLRGEVLPDGRLRLIEAHVHPRRRVKWFVSGSTAILVGALGMGWYWQARRGKSGPGWAAPGPDA
jgi:hypothetical protein